MLALALVWTALLSVAAAVPTANDRYPHLLPSDCGLRQIQPRDTTRPFIVGDGNTTAYYGQYPWQARLLTYKREVRGFTHQCGAIVITDHHVLTAAHCVHDVAKSSILVRVGELKLVRSDAESDVKEFGVASIHIHYRYTGAPGLPNDIALLRLRIRPGDSLKFNAYVAPACLPAASAVYETNLPCEVSGWGRTGDSSLVSEQLRGVEVPLISDEFCLTPEIYQDRFVPGLMFCAGLTLGGPDSCRGDSGGPLACMDERRGRFIAYGIVSSGDPLGCGLRPGLYTKVSHYVSWIKRRLQLDTEDKIAETSQQGSDFDCGSVTFRPPTYINTGRVLSKEHFPWMVPVLEYGRLGCSGVIISERWILTASLCVPDRNPTVLLDSVQDSTDSLPNEIEIEHVAIQPPPKELSRKPVFALLKTKERIRLNANQKPICLPDDSSLSPVRAGLDLIFVAWRLPLVEPIEDEQAFLRWSRLRVVDIEGCKANYSVPTKFKHISELYFHDDTFCTKYLPRNGESKCAIGKGDGGGVFVDRLIGSDGRESWRVLGTAVAGRGCGSDTYPDLNAAVGPVVPWIRSVLDEDAFLNQLQLGFSCDRRMGMN